MSSLEEMGPGTHFKPVLGDNSVNSASVSRVVFCSGKHYYALAKHREATNSMDTAIVRLEVRACLNTGVNLYACRSISHAWRINVNHLALNGPFTT